MLVRHFGRNNVVKLLYRSSSTSSTLREEMPSCDFQPEAYSGPSYEQVTGIRKNLLNPALFAYYKKPVLIHQGHMQWLWDQDNRRYLDMFGGIVTVSVGHCHPKVNAALRRQIDKLWHTTNIYYHPKIHEYAKKLLAKLPENLKVAYFVNSGSEANDLAVLMARLHTKRWEFVTLRNAYHGASPFMMGATALRSWRFNSPTGFGIVNTMNADPYQGPWGGSDCRDSPVQTDRKCDCPVSSGQRCCAANERYLEQLKDTLQFSTAQEGVAGFMAESIQGVGGTVQFPRNFLRGACDMIHAHGGVFVADEVQTGFGRLGTHFWGFESHGVQPDIVTMAKGIGNGFPLAAVVTTPEIAASMSTALHFNTFGGNPMSCAVGEAVLEVMEEEKTQENCHKTGTYFLQELGKLSAESRVIGDVRGKGLMIGVELVEDKVTRKPLSADKVMTLWEATKDAGLLIGKGGLYGNVFRIKPPMCINKADVDFAIKVLRTQLKLVE